MATKTIGEGDVVGVRRVRFSDEISHEHKHDDTNNNNNINDGSVVEDDDDDEINDPLWSSLFPSSYPAPPSASSASASEMYDDLGFPFEPRVVEARKEKVDSEYDVQEEIGKGKFGRVHKAVHKTTGEPAERI